MTGDADIEGLAKAVYAKSRDWDSERKAQLLVRLMDCFEDEREWLSAVQEYAAERLADL